MIYKFSVPCVINVFHFVEADSEESAFVKLNQGEYEVAEEDWESSEYKYRQAFLESVEESEE
jgi:hypothetical protein